MKIPGKPFRGKDALAKAFSHLDRYHRVSAKDASFRLHKLKQEAGLAPDDECAIGRTGDVYVAVSGDRLGTLTDKGLGNAP